MTSRRLPAADLLELVCTPDTDTAHALLRFDWGVPLVEVPRLVSGVRRTTELTELTALFTDSVKTRTPKVAVLVGVTGFGKTTIAADFCHPQSALLEGFDKTAFAAIRFAVSQLGTQEGA
jgi:hypothetical protein